MNLLATAYKQVEIEGIVIPACICGQALSAHTAESCYGYSPREAFRALGPIGFVSHSRIATFLWKAEQFLSRVRTTYLKD